MKILSAILLLVLPMIGFAQISISSQNAKVFSTVKRGPVLIASITYTTAGADTTYNLEFNNADEDAPTLDLNKVSFSGSGNTLSGLYEVLKSFFSEEHKKNKAYMVEFELGGSKITASNVRVLGKTSIMIKTPEGFFYLTENQVDKLFNK